MWVASFYSLTHLKKQKKCTKGGRKRERKKHRVDSGLNLALNHQLFAKLHNLLLIEEPC